MQMGVVESNLQVKVFFAMGKASIISYKYIFCSSASLLGRWNPIRYKSSFVSTTNITDIEKLMPQFSWLT